MICSNGAIGYSRAFRSDISLGKNMSHCISRALESYDNGDGGNFGYGLRLDATTAYRGNTMNQNPTAPVLSGVNAGGNVCGNVVCP